MGRHQSHRGFIGLKGHDFLDFSITDRRRPSRRPRSARGFKASQKLKPLLCHGLTHAPGKAFLKPTAELCRRRIAPELLSIRLAHGPATHDVTFAAAKVTLSVTAERKPIA
jgi:hypothetical protein